MGIKTVLQLSLLYVQSALEESLPILFVLEPEAVPISDAFKLVQDYGRENWTRTIERL